MAKKSFFNSSVEGIIKSYDQPRTGESTNGAPAAEFLSGQASAPAAPSRSSRRQLLRWPLPLRRTGRRRQSMPVLMTSPGRTADAPAGSSPFPA